MGENNLNYNSDFMFYVTTKLPSPHYSPEICVKMTMLNFMVTPEGLLDQILNEIIRIEERKKYDQRNQGIQTKANNAMDFARLQDEILHAITNASDDILEDTELKEKLDQSKSKCNEIEQSNAEVASTMKIIDKIRDENKDVGLRVSRLFFVISDLQNVNAMYQYSLDFFKTIFEETVKAAGDSIEKNQKAKKKEFWKDTFCSNLYAQVSRSLFQQDNLTFSFLLWLKIRDEELIPEGGLPKELVRFLLAGATQVEFTKPNPTGEGGWLVDKSWLTILEMSSKFKIFEGLDDSIANNLASWEKIYNSADP